MPVYPFRCECGEESSTVRSMSMNTTDKNCPNCGEAMNRVFTVPAVSIYAEQFSYATGQMVSSERQFKEQLKIASEEQTARTGIPCNYVPTEPAKPIEGPGTDEQARKHRELGTPGFERKKSYL